jgi:hypothetical protein
LSKDSEHPDPSAEGSPVNLSSAISDSQPPLPLQRLVALLPDEGETDARWGARRQGERIPFCRPIALARLDRSPEGEIAQIEIEAIFDGWALNVCHGGMRIITEQPLKQGDTLQIEVSSSGTAYSGKAHVCWVRQEADGVVAGLEFKTPPLALKRKKV